jgi:group I intron endonuclease
MILRITVKEFQNSKELFISRSIAGIYAILNINNGTRYVGSAVSIYDRFYGHIWYLEKGTHRNKKLLNAWRKHGKPAFTFEVIEILSDPSSLLEREQYWIDHHNSHRQGYNLNPTAGSNLGRKFDSEVRINMADAARRAMADPEVKKLHRQAMRASMSKPEVREKCRQAALQRWADPFIKEKMLASRRTPEAREKNRQRVIQEWASMSPEQKQRRGLLKAKQYQIQWPDGRVEMITNLTAFCRLHGLDYTSAQKVLCGRQKTLKGIIIRRERESSSLH